MKCFKPDCEKEAKLGLQFLLCREGYTPQEAWAKVGICEVAHAPSEEGIYELMEQMWPYIEVDFVKNNLLPPVLDDSGWAWVPIDVVEEQFKQAKEFVTETKKWRN